ncbi:Sensory transduction protein LytR [compost metagenome]
MEAGADGLTAYTKSNRYTVKETLQFYENLWASKGFIRINKSQLVNLLQVKEIIPWFNSRYVLRMDNNVELEVSKMFSKKLRNTLHI